MFDDEVFHILNLTNFQLFGHLFIYNPWKGLPVLSSEKQQNQGVLCQNHLQGVDRIIHMDFDLQPWSGWFARLIRLACCGSEVGSDVSGQCMYTS